MRILQQFLYPPEKLGRSGPVNDPMIRGQCQPRHEFDPNPSSFSHGFLNRPSHPEDRTLGRVDDSIECIDSKYPQVEQGKGSPRYLVHGKLPVPGLLG